MSRTETLVLTMYAGMLRLYPRLFRHQFAEEMRDVFAMAIAEASHHSLMAFLRICLIEMIDLPISILGEHMTTQQRKWKQDTVHRARWITRLGAFGYSLFLVVVTLTSSKIDSLLSLAFLTFFSIMLVSILIAWRWEYAGSIVILTSATLLGLIILTSIWFPGMEIYAILSTILWTLPYWLFGGMFLVLGKRSRTVKRGRALGLNMDGQPSVPTESK